MPIFQQRKIGWLGIAAFGFGGANLSIFAAGALIQSHGTIIIPLLALTFFLTIGASLGYLELVLMYPHKVGGIATACTEAFRPYNPILTNIIGVGYWMAWIISMSLAADYSVTLLQQFFFPSISVNWVSSLLMCAIGVLALFGLKLTQNLVIPFACAGALFAFGVVLGPMIAGSINWDQASHYSFIAPPPDYFMKLSSIMAAVYILGGIVPAYEGMLCYVGEVDNPQKNVPKALFVVMALAACFNIIFPSIWLGIIGSDALVNNFAPAFVIANQYLFSGLAKALVAGFVVFNMIVFIFTAMNGASRTLAQLSQDALLPKFLSKTNRFQSPWVSIIVSTALALLITWKDAPLWLVAATNFLYVLCIAAASLAVYLLRRNAPDAPRLYRAPTIFIYLGLLSALFWTTSIILGFRQYGLSTMIAGISFSFCGVPFYIWRKIQDRNKQNLPLLPRSLHIKLTGIMLTVLIFDAIGYLIAVNIINDFNSVFVFLLEDIFVLVALITITVGLILPGTIVYAAEAVNLGAKRINDKNLADLMRAMKALGEGNLQQEEITSHILPLEIMSNDEIGEMAKSFNLMQDNIQKAVVSFNNVRARLQKAMKELSELNTNLEKRIVDRTEKLQISNENLTVEIAERIKIQGKIAELHNELIIAARRAGMADIATSVLHNMGNVLSSVKTASGLIHEKVSKSEVDKLLKIILLLEEHQGQLDTFLTIDPQGKLILKYLKMLSENLISDKKFLLEEANTLENNIEHIVHIIAMQQSLSDTLGLIEDISLPTLVKDALMITKIPSERAKIQMICDLADIKTVSIDRVKLLQIMVNLIKNSIDALKSNLGEKKIWISLEAINEHFFKFKVRDNGMGISNLNLNKIFNSGFTTKQDGQGFGLHTSSLAAQEMGGGLTAESRGEGKGATFVLILPFSQQKGLKYKQEVNEHTVT